MGSETRNGGTKIYCPKCGWLLTCKVVQERNIRTKQRYYTHRDIDGKKVHFLRRLRVCGKCLVRVAIERELLDEFDRYIALWQNEDGEPWGFQEAHVDIKLKVVRAYCDEQYPGAYLRKQAIALFYEIVTDAGHITAEIDENKLTKLFDAQAELEELKQKFATLMAKWNNDHAVQGEFEFPKYNVQAEIKSLMSLVNTRNGEVQRGIS